MATSRGRPWLAASSASTPSGRVGRCSEKCDSLRSPTALFPLGRHSENVELYEGRARRARQFSAKALPAAELIRQCQPRASGSRRSDRAEKKIMSENGTAFAAATIRHLLRLLESRDCYRHEIRQELDGVLGESCAEPARAAFPMTLPLRPCEPSR